jgi:hypothetical protein
MTLTAGLHPDEVPLDESPYDFAPGSDSHIRTSPPAAGSAGRPDVLIITGTRDMQIFSSARAWDVCRRVGLGAELEVMQDAEHRYASRSTERIWRFFAARLSGKP